MQTPITNTRTQRKSLAAEIERLGRVVEALEDGLKTTVAQVVREAVLVAVQQTIQAIVAETLAQPELLQQLATLTAPPPPPGATAASLGCDQLSSGWESGAVAPVTVRPERIAARCPASGPLQPPR